MESTEWSVPKKDTSDFLFLYPFYKRGMAIWRDSPEHAREMNLRRANQVAAKAVEKITRFSKLYEDGDFPVIDMDDPCSVLSKLPVSMHVPRHGSFDGYSELSLRPVLERKAPSSSSWLGRLVISTYREDNIHIDKVCLNQPGENHGIELYMWPAAGRQSYGGNMPTDSYPANAQAMNFIEMVDDYLDKLDRHRLIIVG